MPHAPCGRAHTYHQSLRVQGWPECRHSLGKVAWRLLWAQKNIFIYRVFLLHFFVNLSNKTENPTLSNLSPTRPQVSVEPSRLPKACPLRAKPKNPSLTHLYGRGSSHDQHQHHHVNVHPCHASVLFQCQWCPSGCHQRQRHHQAARQPQWQHHQQWCPSGCPSAAVAPIINSGAQQVAVSDSGTHQVARQPQWHPSGCPSVAVAPIISSGSPSMLCSAAAAQRYRVACAWCWWCSCGPPRVAQSTGAKRCECRGVSCKSRLGHTHTPTCQSWRVQGMPEWRP